MARSTPANKTVAAKSAANKARFKAAVAPQALAYKAGEKTGRAVRSAASPKGKLTAANPKRLILAEYLICFVVLGAGTVVAPNGKGGGVPRLMVRGTALSAVFLILSLASGAGGKTAKAAAGLGGLITLAYVVTSQDGAALFTWMAGFFSTQGTGAATAPAATSSGAVGEAGLILESALAPGQAAALNQSAGAVGDAGKLLQQAVVPTEIAAGGGELTGGILSAGQGSGVPVRNGGSTAE